jgi:hypothetical protein
MKRREFMKTTGLSLGALLIGQVPRSSEHGPSSRGRINFPDEILVYTDNGAVPLKASDGRKWIGTDIGVELLETRDGLAVEVQSPETPLRSIVVRWARPAAMRYMGDQWERSYGDLQWKPVDGNRILPWYFMEFAGRATNGFGVKTGCRSMCSWQVGAEQVQLMLDVRTGGIGVRLGERRLRAAEIVVRRGVEGESPFAATRAFCSMLCDAPRLPKEPVYGINDWYFTYGNNSEDLILDHVRLIADLASQNDHRPYCVIDAGWATKSPLRPRDPAWGDDFSSWNGNFGDMAALAAKIKSSGMRPGIWVRPLCAGVKDEKSRILPPIPGRKDPTSPILDPTIPENLQRIKNLFLLYRKWGYELIKHDFTTFDILGKWGFQMIESRDITSDNWGFNDRSITTAEIIFNLYEAIREAAGETTIIACNAVSHLAAGLAEIQRVGDDTSGLEWERTRKMGVNTLGFRIAQHKTFYAADGDCVGLTTKIPWAKNRQWMQLVAQSGTPLFISAQKEAVGAEQRAYIKECFATASRPIESGEPLDWLENPFPAEWRLLGKVVRFNWE